MKSAKAMFGSSSIFALGGVALTLALLGGCGAPPGAGSAAAGGATAAVINGEAVSQELLEAFAKARNLDLSRPALRERALKQISDFVLLEQAAKQAGYLDDPEFVAAAELGRLQGLALAMMKKLGDPAQIDAATLRAEYERQYAADAAKQYDFGQIVFATREDAAKAIAQISPKNTFDQMLEARGKDVRFARNFSKVRSTQLPPELAGALAALAPGEVGKAPVQLAQGWAIVRVGAVDAAPPPPLEQVEENLRRSLARRHAEERMKALRAQAKIAPDPTPAAAPDAPPAPSPAASSSTP